jgi:hypothetical protein
MNFQVSCIGVLGIAAQAAKTHFDPSMKLGMLFENGIGDKTLSTDIAKPGLVTRMSQ